MSFSRYFKIVSILLAVLVGASFAAKNNSGKVRFVNGGPGDVTRQKEGNENWDDLRMNQKVFQGDMIKTLIESQAIIALPDGSTLTIEENSLVSMAEIMSEDGVNRTTAEIKSGKMRFDVQKQGNKESSFKFKTGTATAAIRGTDGVVGLSKSGKFFATLGSGKLDISFGDRQASIEAGQTAFPKGSDIVVMTLASSGNPEFMSVMEEILDDSTLVADSLEAKIMAKDSEFNTQKESLKDSIQCSFSTIPDTIYEASIVVKAQCSADIEVELGAEKIKSNGGEIQFTPNWAPSTIGEKKFPATCFANKISIPCGMLNTYYAGKVVAVSDTTVIDSVEAVPDTVVHQHTPLTITTASPVTVCDPAAVTIEGSFDPEDPNAQLFVSLGNYTSTNLVPLSAKGQFSHTITINDKKNNWNETKAHVEYKSALYGTEKATIELDIRKSCKNVNTERPELIFTGADSLSCKANFRLNKANDDIVIFTPSVDGSSYSNTYYDKNTSFQYSLTSGLHKYTFEAEDQAGNKSAVSKTLGCYPPSQSYSLSIHNGTYERLHVPPPPSNIRNSFNRLLRFQINGIPQNDPVYIKQITISQEGKPTITLRETDFQSTSFDQQIELVRDKNTKVVITVKMKNGRTLSATKTYKVH